MKIRRGGRRIGTIAGKRRRTGSRSGTRQIKTEFSAGERRHLAQLVICSCVFVLLVAAKLLLPGKMQEVNTALNRILEQNMDVQTVFSAVGRAFSGEEDLGDVYQAVFEPEEYQAVRTSAAVSMEEVSAMDTLREYRVEELPEAVEPVSVETLAYVLYSDQNLPESASLEQDLLGFDYCSPLPGATVSSEYGYREHPVEGEERFHYGIDLAANTGTAISCFADGTVKAVGESSSYGKYCIVDHGGGYSTLYAHCSRITTSSGREVSGGEKIAEVGETGIATGPHLHFELQKDGTYLNPVYYVTAL